MLLIRSTANPSALSASALDSAAFPCSQQASSTAALDISGTESRAVSPVQTEEGEAVEIASPVVLNHASSSPLSPSTAAVESPSFCASNANTIMSLPATSSDSPSHSADNKCHTSTTTSSTRSRRVLLGSPSYNPQARPIPTTILEAFENHTTFAVSKLIRDSLMGCVLLATHIPSKTPVVIKAYWWECLEYNLSLERVPLLENPEREWAIHSRITTRSDSPFLLRFFGLIEEHEITYAVLELGGRDLFDYLSGDNVSLEVVEIFLKQFLTGVAQLHSMNIAHRDLSIENILLSNDEKSIKIIDYGVAVKRHRDMLMSAGPVGKLQYMAPEVYLRKNFDPFKADVWSCGVVILTALLRTNTYQVPADTDKVFRYYFRQGRFAELAKKCNVALSEEAQDLLCHMLAPAAQRYSMEQVLAHPWMKQ